MVLACLQSDGDVSKIGPSPSGSFAVGGKNGGKFFYAGDTAWFDGIHDIGARSVSIPTPIPARCPDPHRATVGDNLSRGTLYASAARYP